MSKEAMKLALEALKNFEKAGLATLKTIDAITAIKQALEQPEPEPVAWMNKHGACMSAVFKQVDATAGEYTTPLYTSPPKREWQWLTDEEIESCNRTTTDWGEPCVWLWDDDFEEGGLQFARAIEAKLKEKNSG